MTALVIGGGPAGLMAADALSSAGHPVILAEAKPSLARKFLMAGKSGLNLTRRQDRESFLAAYGDRMDILSPIVDAFDNRAIEAWASDLGQEMFAGPTGRVFPKVMKASPLLRAWLAHLMAQGVEARTRWRWTGFDGPEALFDTPEGPQAITADVTILAMGGASWSRLGSDGAWASVLDAPHVPFQPANGGLRVAWSKQMTTHFGAPIKGVRWLAGEAESRGEATLSSRGLEGGGIYDVFAAVRDGAPLVVDLLPDVPEDAVRGKLAKRPAKLSLANHLRRAVGLDAVRRALLMEFGRPLPDDLAPLLKALPITHDGPRPMDEAISTAGGVSFDAVTPGLELRNRPGTFVCGEMLDWEAPTGGYLLTACLATGLWAGRHAAERLVA